MPFQKGNKLSPGRKGWEIEHEQLVKMSTAIGRDLALLEKIQKGNATPEEMEIFELVQERIKKYLDKLHASKTNSNVDVTSAGEQIVFNLPAGCQESIDEATAKIKDKI